MVLPTFAAWAAMYGKVYNGDEASREAIYNANVEWILSNNEDGTQGLSPFMDMTRDEFNSQYLSFKPETRLDNGVANLGKFEATGADTPDEIDWSAKGAVSPVKDQGSCGSCWAFSTVGSLEGRAQIATGTLQQFSEQQFVDCDKDFGDEGCNGGLMDNAFKYLMQSKGACTEESYGYKGRGASCQIDSCTIGLPASQITGFQDVDGTEAALEEAVAQGPVSVAVEANTVFQFYNKGIVKTNLCGASLDHGVLAVGYGVEDGTKYWKVKNSWNSRWGENGYIRLLKGKGSKGECGILSGPPSFPVIASSVTV